MIRLEYNRDAADEYTKSTLCYLTSYKERVSLLLMITLVSLKLIFFAIAVELAHATFHEIHATSRMEINCALYQIVVEVHAVYDFDSFSHSRR